MDSPHKRPVIWTICLLTCLPERAAEQSVKLPVTRDAIAPMWRQCYGFGKSNDSIQKTICRKSRWRHQIEAFSAGLLCGELTGHRWIPHAKARNAELWFFIWSAPGPTVELTMETLVIWDAIALINGFQAISSLYALQPQVCQVCASCGNKSLSSCELPHFFLLICSCACRSISPVSHEF